MTAAKDALDLAREFHRSGDYPAALANYSHFFEHCLDDDPGMYGVRLSYCLAGWARLGRKHPPALEALRERRAEALRRLEATRDPAHFHDFRAMSEYLGYAAETVDIFLRYHASDPELARNIVRFVWSQLVDAAKWEICETYLGDPEERYAIALFRFDQSMGICRTDAQLGSAEFKAQIKGWYVRDMSELQLVLRHTNRAIEAQVFAERAIRDAIERDFPEAAEAIAARLLQEAPAIPDAT